MWIPQWHEIQPVLHWLGLLSLCTFIISLALIPWLIGRLPSDYFCQYSGSPQRRSYRSGPGRIFWFVLRNSAGMILFLAGVIMLFLPGQGILTIIVGFSLMTFPGKHRLLSALTAKPSVQHGLDWIRLKTGQQGFIWPAKGPGRLSSL